MGKSLSVIKNHSLLQSLVGSTRLQSSTIVRAMSTSSVNAVGGTFDFIVIGGGSGGLACAKRAASYGASVCIVEAKAFGGTCVNVGCVPKKVMFNAAHVAEVIKQAKEFGFTVGETTFDWSYIKQARDTYISRLNGIYERGLDSVNITRINGYATIQGVGTVQVGEGILSAKHILIAVGGAPNALGVPGEEHVIDSDGFFALIQQPKKVGVIGAGYIAVELAGVLKTLGSDTSLFIRKDFALRTFDTMIQKHLAVSMKHAEINVVPNSVVQEISREMDGSLSLTTTSGQLHSGFDVLIAATGRHPLTKDLNLSSASVATDIQGYITVDEYQNTSASGIYALGDVCGKLELTPMAIAAGRRLADRLFGGMPTAKADYSMVPTVVFSHPTIGVCGLTEEEATAAHGADMIKVYNSSFVNLWYGPFFKGAVGDKPITKYKLVCLLPDEKVIGLHSIGMGSDEVLQGFSVAMKMGATKADFDNAIAIHPTAAEEMVTIAPWGLSAVHTRSLKGDQIES